MDAKKQDIGLAIESGEYYRDALKWYSTLYNSPIAERVLLIIIAILAGIVTLMAVVSLFMLTPLAETRTMIVHLPQSIDRVARVQPLVSGPADDPSIAMRDWLIGNYVLVRESYDIAKQEQYNYRVWALSAPGAYTDYVNLYKSNQSPTLRYERHTRRVIEIRSIQILDIRSLGKQDGKSGDTEEVKARVQFVATEITSTEERKSAWSADIAFRFDKINVDQITGEVSPFEPDETTGKTVYKGFVVTGYQNRQLGLE